LEPIGPIETIDLNSAQDVSGYCDRLGRLYYDLAKEQADPHLAARINGQRRAAPVGRKRKKAKKDETP